MKALFLSISFPLSVSLLVSCNYRVFDLQEYPELGGNPINNPFDKVTEDNFASIMETVIKPQCISCHKAGGKAEAYPFNEYKDFLATTDDGELIVNAGKPEESALYTVMIPREDGKPPRMPPAKAGLPPVAAERIEAVRAWIAKGAPEN